jgi:hypothetical protein
MEIGVAEQGLFLLPVKITEEQARERAWEQKLNVFGTLSKFLMRPKGEEIQVAVLELRYQPFWHAASHKRFKYDRDTQYQVAVPADVHAVDIAGQSYPASAGRITLQGLDHCLLEERKELFLDGLSGQPQDMQRYLKFDRVAAAADQPLSADVALVPPGIRASAVIRQVLGDVLHPASADRVLEETVVVDRLDLYYRPVYAFEYIWEAKGKRATVEVDGLTGEFKASGTAFGSQLKRVLNRDVLFDIGGETLNLVVPGGAIALKLTKALMDQQRSGSA